MENVPILQGLQKSIESAPNVEEKYPTSQGKHTEALVAPTTVPKVPAPHKVHDTDPTLAAYVPALHSVQTNDAEDEEKEPNGHKEQTVDAGDVEIEPGWHGAHVEALNLSEKLPIGHDWQDDEPEAEYRPGVHDWHSVDPGNVE